MRLMYTSMPSINNILPKLVRMFPKIQFIVTSHSPLFVLGMKESFGEDGLGLYRLPEGTRITSEEFSEFGNAYSAFTTTQKYAADIKGILAGAERPIVLVEGTTDKRYIEHAAILLGKTDLVDSLQIRDGGGSANLKKYGTGSRKNTLKILPNRVLLLFDCDETVRSCEKDKLYRRGIPPVSSNPITTGIETYLVEPPWNVH